MKRSRPVVATCLAALLASTSACAGRSGPDRDARPGPLQEFCWRDTHTRGVGTVPQRCREGQDRIGLLCYPECPAGTRRFGFDCHSVCPEGMRNDGLFCRAAEYGRGAGYPWKFGDKLNDRGMRRRCEAAHGAGGCEKSGAIFYPKCKPGYHAVGCCICRPHRPDCTALGLKPGIDLSCAKHVIIGKPTTGACRDGEEKDAGLCYRRCRAGYKGVGPVCWSKAPPGWEECGMGAASSKRACASIVLDQVQSVGTLALTVASLGTSTAATASEKGAASAAELTRLRKLYRDLKDAYEHARPAIEGVQRQVEVANVEQEVAKLGSSDQPTAEDIARVAAEIAALADPTGVTDTVAAYTYPKCSKYF